MPQDSFASLVELIEIGQYEITAPETIRNLFKAAEPPPQAQTGARAELASVVRAYRKRSTERFVQLVETTRGRMLVGPLIGDGFLQWPFDRPFDLDDDSAVKWLSVVEASSAPNAAILLFVRIAFCSIRREVWTHSIRAMATFAALRPELDRELQEIWTCVFPSSLHTVHKLDAAALLPEHLPGEYATLRVVHLRRHAFVAACEIVARFGKFGTVGAGELLAIHAEGMNDADLSAVVLGWERLVGSTDSAIRDLAAARVRTLGAQPLHDCGELTEHALLRIADRCRKIPDDETMSAMLAVLQQRRWDGLNVTGRVDLIWSWLETAAWCKSAGRAVELQQIRDVSREVEPALSYRVDGALPGEARNAVDAIEPAIRILADTIVWSTTPVALRAAAVVEAALLLEHPDLQHVPFDLILQRATGKPGLLKFNGRHRVALVLLLASREVPPEVLLRDLRLDEEAVLQLAAMDNGFITRQAAIQAEQLLRGANPEAQLKFLWRLLQKDPPRRLLRELLGALPGSGSLLHNLVEAVETLELARDDEANHRTIADAYVRVAGAAARLLSTGAEPSATAQHLLAMSKRFAALPGAEGPTVGSDAWMALAGRVLFGEAKDGLVNWLEWLGSREDKAPPERFTALRSAWDSLRACIAAARKEKHASEPQCLALAEALSQVRAALTLQSWPEEIALAKLLEELDKWRHDELSHAQRLAETDALVRSLLDAADENRLIDTLRADNIEVTTGLLSPETIRAFHSYLLAALRAGDATRLRRVAERQVRLPHVLTYFSPLMLGALGGVWLVLDIPQEWASFADKWWGLEYLVTVLGAHGLSLLLLATTFTKHTGWGKTWPLRIRRTGAILAVHGLAFTLATISTAALMWIFRDTALVMRAHFAGQLVLWSSLSLFLGLFLGLILQDRSMTTLSGE